jgi:hypothetical protein
MGDVLTPKIIDTVGSSYRNRRNPHVVLGIADRFADGDALNAGEADDVAGGGLFDFRALQAIEGKQLGDLRLLNGPTELQHRHRAVQLHGAVEDAADRDASEVVARVEIGDRDLQRRVGVAAGRRHVLDDRVEQRRRFRRLRRSSVASPSRALV